MEIVILLIIIVLLGIVLFLVLKKIINNITKESKDYYLKKMQDYDALLYEKEQSINNVAQEEKQIESGIKGSSEDNAKVDKDLLNIINKTDYKGQNLFAYANELNNVFNLDEEQIIKKFINQIQDNSDYQIIKNLRNKLDIETIYHLKELDYAKQMEYLNNFLDNAEISILNSYLKQNKFKINDFIEYLDEQVIKLSPDIEIITGNKQKSFDYLSPYIHTKYQDNIYKGFIIKYQGTIYDYSINERDL